MSLVAAFLLLTACGGQLYTTGVTKQGIHVLTDPEIMDLIDIEDVGYVVQETTNQFAIATGRSFREVNKVWSKKVVFSIEFVSEDIPCPKDGEPDRVCSGLFVHPGTMKVLILDGQPSGKCLAKSSLSHEIVHLLGLHVEGDPDGDHNDPRLFEGNWSAEWLAETVTKNTLCPDKSCPP